MQIDPNRPVRPSGACRDLRTGHALDKAQNQCLPVCIRQAPYRFENLGGRAFMIPAAISAPDLVLRLVIRQMILRRRMPVVVIRQIAGDGGQPRSKASGVP
jgi:hypothetical protein